MIPNMQPQNQGMATFLQAMQGQPGGQPGMPQVPQGGSPQPPQQPGQQMQPGQPPQAGQGPSPQMLQMIQQLMKQGRGGDTLLAHLTPGEMEVPKEVQTPKVLATLNQAYKEKGVSPQQFTAGSPQSSLNPATGLPEYNFMSAFLPAALGIAGSVAMPYLAPEIGSALLASSVGAGLGTTAGSLAVGKSPTQSALAGLGAGAGGYGMGSLMGGAAGSAAGDGISSASTGAANSPAVESALTQSLSAPTSTGLAATGQAAAHAPVFGSQMLGNAVGNFNPYQAAGSTIGSMVGNSIGAPPKPVGPAYPPGFNTPMTPMSQLPSAQQQLGQNASVQPRANFTGYNPMTYNPAAFNFFPGNS